MIGEGTQVEIRPFQRLRLIGGFSISKFELQTDLEDDAAGRASLALTRISGRDFHIIIRADLDDREKSVSLYHEVLEAMAVAAEDPPESLPEFNEGDFEKAAYQAHQRLGPVTPSNLKRMLQSYGFRES